MTKEMLPKQSYELINVCRQTVETGTPLTCDHCGKIIFNIATIKGKTDGKIYNVGLTCVKKLLNKTIYFDIETRFKYESEVYLWNNAINARKWVERKNKDGLYMLYYKDFYDKNEGKTFCYIELRFKNDNSYAGHSAMIEERFKSVFDGIVNLN